MLVVPELKIIEPRLISYLLGVTYLFELLEAILLIITVLLGLSAPPVMLPLVFPPPLMKEPLL